MSVPVEAALTPPCRPRAFERAPEAASVLRLVARNTGAQAAAFALSLALGLLTTAALSRHLGVERFGHFSYVFVFFYFFLAIADLGINVVVVREASKRPDRAGAIVGSMVVFKLVTGLLAMLLAWAVIGLLPFPGDLRRALVLYAAVLPLAALQLPAAIFQIALKMHYQAALGLCGKAISFILLMIGIACGYGLPLLIGAVVLGEIASVLLTLALARRFVRIVWRPEPAIWGQILRSGIWLAAAGLFGALLNRLDFIMLERMRGFEQVGLYAAAYRVTNLLEAFPLMIMGTVYPLMARFATDDLERLHRLYTRSFIWLGIAALILGVVVTVFATRIVEVLAGATFADAARGLRALVWATVFLYPALAGGNLLVSIGRESTSLAILVLAGALDVALNLWLIPRMGFVGAALATSTSYAVVLLGTVSAVRFHMGRRVALVPVERPCRS